MAKQPAIRASALRDALSYLDSQRPGGKARVLARLPEETRRAVNETARTGWIDIEHDTLVLDAMVAELGAQRAVEFWAGSVQELSSKPLLHAFVSGMLKVVNVDAARVVSLIITAWPLAFRDFCDLRSTTDEGGRPTLRFENVAALVQRNQHYALPWHGICVGGLRVARLPGEVRFRVGPELRWAEAVFVA